jgi:phosphoribosyl 1,2-cyclic phosphate phosphodiesterase
VEVVRVGVGEQHRVQLLYPGGDGLEPELGAGGAAVFVYLTDTSAVPEASRAIIAPPGVLIVDGLRVNPHETHFSFEQALVTARELGARRTWLTHICHTHSHREIEEVCAAFRNERKLPEEITMQPAWDGLEIDL